MTHPMLDKPIQGVMTQTVLPVVELVGSGAVVRGMFFIDSTDFDGTEIEFTLPEGPVPLKRITLPRTTVPRVQQYMAVVFDHIKSVNREYMGYSGFVDVNLLAPFRNFVESKITKVFQEIRGPLLSSLSSGMDVVTSAPQDPTTPPESTDAAVQWYTSLPVNAPTPQCTFFDFNWMTSFDTQTDTREPLRIEVVSNPSTPQAGAFKASIAPLPVAVPGGTVYDTIRILRLATGVIEPGDYVFTFKISDTHGRSTTAELTLTVPAP